MNLKGVKSKREARAEAKAALEAAREEAEEDGEASELDELEVDAFLSKQVTAGRARLGWAVTLGHNAQSAVKLKTWRASGVVVWRTRAAGWGSCAVAVCGVWWRRRARRTRPWPTPRPASTTISWARPWRRTAC